MRIECIPALLLAVASSVDAAGTVNVRFIDADRFTDIGRSTRERDTTLSTIEQHLRQLAARHLADGQTLTLEITDVDLAGNLRLLGRRADEVRVVKGTADWPRIALRYTLEAAGQPPKRGDAQLSDLNYTGHITSYGSGEPLRYEKQMLDAWFKASFAAPQ
jgi:hypothetical protein